jgi:hypothetical protein
VRRKEKPAAAKAENASGGRKMRAKRDETFVRDGRFPGVSNPGASREAMFLSAREIRTGYRVER